MSAAPIGMALRPGLSFCLIADKVLFLDVARDRYFCLAAPLERSFLNLVAGLDLASDAQEKLLSNAILVPARGVGAPRPCTPPPTNNESLLDAARGRWRVVETGWAFLALTRAQRLLDKRGLAALLSTFAGRKARCGGGGAKERAMTVVDAFARTGYLSTTHDRCLLRSVAIAGRLVSAGLRPDLVLGVKLEPFKAHCWVQHEGTIVNDRWDVTREFTPILVL